MKPKPCVSILVAAILLLSVVTSLIACTGDTGTTPTSVSRSTVASTGSVGPLTTEPLLAADGTFNEDLSTFESKDPFIQQVTATTTDGGQTPNTDTTQYTSTTYNPGTTYYTTTTRYYNTTTTWWTTTTKKPATTTTTKPPTTTTTTVAYIHTLKILSVDKVGDAAAVTFRVDNSVYKNRVV